MSQYNYKPAPRYLGKKVTAKLKIGPGNDELLRDAPRLVSIGLEKGWIHPPKDRPMTDSQIQTFRLKNAKADGAAQLHADQA